MTTTVVVPFNPGDFARDRNWAWIRNRYQRLHSQWELVEHSDPGPGEWSKGRAVRHAVDRSNGDTLVIADADVVVNAETLAHAVTLVTQRSAPWVMPHGTVYRLSYPETCNLLKQPSHVDPSPLGLPHLERRQHPGPCGGGIVVCRRDDFETVGGIDERFTNWGGEDISFGRALDTLIGKHTRLRSPMWHLYHPRMKRRPGNRASPENERLAGAYMEAEGDMTRMAELVSHR